MIDSSDLEKSKSKDKSNKFELQKMSHDNITNFHIETHNCIEVGKQII